MGQLTQWQVTQLAEEQVTRALARQLGSIELAAQVACAALTEVATLRCQVSDKVATTLEIADDLVKAASYNGRITPVKEAEVRRHTQQYLDEMLGIAHDASSKIVDMLLRG